MTREKRKLDHVRFALGDHKGRSPFEDIRIVHQALPHGKSTELNLSTSVGELFFSSPILINAMTGGAESTLTINQDLAVIAKETGLAMAVGSQRAALDNSDLISTYRICRDTNPNGILIANLGAGASTEECARAIEMIQADALQLHLNVPQELVMKEGDRDFGDLTESILRVVDSISVPLIVKEVGFGMSRETAKLLIDHGVKIIDVGGRGGTNFIEIENQRRQDARYDFLTRWGQTTPEALLDVRSWHPDVPLVASGGIRHSLDAFKSLALGAQLVGVAGTILKSYMQYGIQQTIQLVLDWHQELRLLMTATGSTTLADIGLLPLVIQGETADWCRARGIHIQTYANRR